MYPLSASKAEYKNKPEVVSQKNPRSSTLGNTQTTGVFTESEEELDLGHRQDHEEQLEHELLEPPAQYLYTALGWR